LQDSGSTNQQATGAAKALSEIVFPDVVTKAKLQTEVAQLRAEIANLKTAVAQWIGRAMFVNVLTMIGVVTAVWQLAGHHP
jgi:branched-subunit amino acid transport protein